MGVGGELPAAGERAVTALPTVWTLALRGAWKAAALRARAWAVPWCRAKGCWRGSFVVRGFDGAPRRRGNLCSEHLADAVATLHKGGGPEAITRAVQEGKL